MYKPVKPVKNIIIGAGPAGIQLGYFFQKAGIDYVILEKAEKAGSFFDTYPHSGQLISINKKNTGSDVPDFNLRHDWNSLLSEDGPKFTTYTDAYYPDHTQLVAYMNDFANKYKLNIKYSSTVEKIRKKEGGYILGVKDTHGKWVYTCEKLIVATGLGKPYKSNITDTTGRLKHYAEYPKNYFKTPETLATFDNKTLLLIGNGNSAYELANLLTPRCSSITILGRSFKKWAMSSHYAGDLRSIYLPYHDTFLLKSLNAFNETGQKIIVEEKEGKYDIHLDCGRCERKHPYDPSPTEGYDHIILCTGWQFDTSIFGFELTLTENMKYPEINHRYESVNNPNLYFIGALMHSHDYKISSGGFIHGFRYLIDYFFHLNYDRKFDIQRFTTKNLNTLVNHILYKINYTSALYQMYGQLVDIFIYNSSKTDITYVNNVHYSFLTTHPSNETLTYFVVSLEYSAKEPETDITKLGGRFTSTGKESHAVLLHPVIRVLKDTPTINKSLVDEIHFDEDLFARFSSKEKYIDKLSRTLKMFIS